MGHAITVNDVLRLDPSPLYENYNAYTCTGTPVDCVKLAIAEVIKGKPDLLVSGINHGENSASNVLYSGTMSAAVEGAMEDIPSIGFHSWILTQMQIFLDLNGPLKKWLAVH